MLFAATVVRAVATVEKPKPSAGLHPPGMGAALVMRGMQLDETKSNSSVPYLRRPPVQSSSSISHGTGTNGSYSLNTAAGSSASTLLMGRGPITGVEVISVSFRQPSPSPRALHRMALQPQRSNRCCILRKEGCLLP